MAQVQIETRKRGIIGWIFLVVFWIFNAAMLYSCAAGMNAATEHSATMASEAEKAGAAVGTGLGLFFILGIWAAGALILGLCVMFTRGNKIIKTVEE